MRVFVDTNVFLDVLMAREPWLTNARRVLDWCDAHPGGGWLAWHTLSNLYYIGAKTVGSVAAKRQIDAILEVFEVAGGDTVMARRAHSLNMPDFEDALQAVAAEACQAKVIITRNVQDYRNSPVKAISPDQFDELL